MFEFAEVGQQIDKETYKTQLPELREALLEAQLDLFQTARFPVLILIGGIDGAGKGETVNKLNEWMDPRHIGTYAFDEQPSNEELLRPAMWRYWRAMPPKGQISIYFGSWYRALLLRHTRGEISDTELMQHMDGIVRFERMLVDEGVLLLKFWLHLSKDLQKERIEKLESSPKTRWRVTSEEKKGLKHYDDFKRAACMSLQATSLVEAPWTIVEGFDANYRNLTVGLHILKAMRERLDHPEKVPREFSVSPLLKAIDHVNPLERLDLGLKLDNKTYDTKLEQLQGKLNKLTRRPGFRKRGLICVFEGVDAAGKGGAIRRITQAIDSRIYRIIPISAPTDEELAQPYLWRFWRRIPPRGKIAIFDRSWYGRVLVERIEGFCKEYDWMRAYGEINDFEAQLVKQGYLVAKFWLQITPEEQLQRFEQRQNTPYKRFKITDEDWRNRDKWDNYQAAAHDMVDRTSTEIAPWTLVEANDKNHARIKILKTLCEMIEKSIQAA
ncbi:MAG: polyphosphate:AMP phosphotransferase [Methylobacillus sp.]|jgi:polyphosphate:AMP phosphotransferase|nr:polyphosphate:AMP phosphotransferase [Methylobacillus sp.]